MTVTAEPGGIKMAVGRRDKNSTTVAPRPRPGPAAAADPLAAMRATLDVGRRLAGSMTERSHRGAGFGVRSVMDAMRACTALADAAMTIACAAACNGYRPIARPFTSSAVTFDVVADARVVRIGRTTSFGRVMLYSAVDRRPTGMVATAYALH